MDHHLGTIKMANQAASYFEGMADRDKAEAAFLAHIRRFWAPSMRREIVRCLEGRDGGELRPFARDALRAAVQSDPPGI